MAINLDYITGPSFYNTKLQNLNLKLHEQVEYLLQNYVLQNLHLKLH